jgi:hypothetical protein
MGLQAIEAGPRYGSRVLPVDQDTGDMTTAPRAVGHGVSLQGLGASIALSAAHRLPISKTAENSREKNRTVADASVTLAVCALWLFIGAVADNALCGESDARKDFVATKTIAQANARQDGFLPVSQAVETTAIEQKQILERGRAEVDIPSDRRPLTEPLDAAQPKAAQASQSVPAQEQKQALEHGQEWDRAEALARALTSSLQGDLDAMRSATETERIKQKQLLDQERSRATSLAHELASLQAELDEVRIVGLKAVQATEAEIKEKQALVQERDRADGLARELASLQAELDKVRIVGLKAVQATEAEIKEKQALVQERDRADGLARELGSLRADVDAARNAGREAAQAAEAEIKQRQALEQAIKQERDRSDKLARELASLRAERNAAPTAGPEVAQAAEAEIKQKQALEQAIKQQRDRADAFARELTSVRSDLATARAAALETAQTTEAARIKQEQAFGKERDKTETLARELAATRKDADVRSALLAAAHAEALQMTETNKAIAAEQKLALAIERDRVDALMRGLTSARSELEAGKRRIAASTALRAVPSSEPAVGSSQERIAASSSSPVEGNGSSEQVSNKVAPSISRPSSVSELARPEAPSAARESASHLVTKVAAGTERSPPTSAAASFLLDEQRLLAQAGALLAQADISGARPLLQQAVERGSARAAFMLAETYDAHVLQSWHASGIAGDRTRARELYERARAGGIEDAKERIEALK